MKPSIKTIAFAVIFAAVSTFNAFAEDKENKKVTAFGTGIFASNTGKIHVNVDKYTAEKAVVLITNNKGETIYREVIGKNTDKFRKALDVKALPAGKYTIEVFADGQKSEKQFEVAEIHTVRQISVN
jgi:hypothetical protein